MKRLFITFFLSIITFSLLATTYWVSPTGTDLATGRSRSAAWQTIAKVNSYATSPGFQPGDIIQFKRGSSWNETLTISNSGTSGRPITFGAWGEGAKPVVSGFTTVTGWTDETGGIYSKVITSESQTNMVTIDGVQYGMGRYPNSSYLTWESVSTNVSITDNQLTGSPDWTDAEVVLKKTAWIMTRATITDHTNSVITYTSLGSTATPDATGNYFFQNALQTLDQFGEWYHDTGTGKFYIYFGAENPADYLVKVATIDNLIDVGTYANITVKNFELTGSIKNVIEAASAGEDLTVSNCVFKNAGLDGIYSGGVKMNVNNCTFTDINRCSVMAAGDSTTITNNMIVNNNYIVGQGDIGTIKSAIYCYGDDPTVELNSIKNTGSNGIHFYRETIVTGLIKNNYIENTCLFTEDHGSIYVPNIHTRVIIDGNVINDANDGNGIYCDDYAEGLVVKNNSVYNCNVGIKLNLNNSDSIYDNTVYDCATGILFANTAYGNEENLTDLVVTGNKIIAKDGQLIINHTTAYTSFATALASCVYDNNYYTRPYNDSKAFRTYDPTNGEQYRTLAEWQTYTSQDANTVSSYPVASDDSVFYAYATFTAKDTTLAKTYIDVTGTAYSGNITIPAWSSVVLLDTTTYTQLLNKDILAYWNFDQNSTTQDDQAGNDDVLTSGTTNYVDGKINKAVEFDGGSADYARAAYSATLVPTGNAFTISFWVKATVTASKYFAQYRNTATGNVEMNIRLTAGNAIEAYFYNTAVSQTYIISAAQTFTDWKMVTIVNYGEGVKAKMFINGLETTIQSTNTFTGTLRKPDTSGYLYFGGQQTAGYVITGLMDEPRYYNRSLTDAEIMALYGL